MDILFDENKEAFVAEGVPYIASVDSSIWEVYCTEKCGDAWDIIDGKFVELIPIDTIRNRHDSDDRIIELKALLSDSDYKAIKFAEGELTEEEFATIREQRRHWREEINALEKH